MIRRIKAIPLLLSTVFFLSYMLLALPVSAASDIQRVYDNAGLLSDDEIDKLEQQAEKYSAKRNINYLIVTTDNPEELLGDVNTGGSESTTEAYSDKFYDNFAGMYEQKEANCTILTIDMSSNTVDVAGKGLEGEIYNQIRRDLVREKITPLLSDGKYYLACSKYIKLTDNYIGIKEGMNPESPILKLWFQALIALAIGGIVVGIMVFNTGGRMTVNQGTYLDQKDSRILAKRDLYVRTTTTRIRKPQNNSSGGGAGGGGGGSNGHSSGHF